VCLKAILLQMLRSALSNIQMERRAITKEKGRSTLIERSGYHLLGTQLKIPISFEILLKLLVNEELRREMVNPA